MMANFAASNNTMKFYFFSVFIIGTTLYAQPILPEEVLREAEKRIADEIYPGLVIGIVDQTGSQIIAFGAKSHHGESVDEHTVFEIGSITKTFNGIMLAYLDLADSLKINDPVSKYLPDDVTMPSRDNTEITLGHLADHTSALPRLPDNMLPSNPMDPYADYSDELLYAFLSAHTLRRDIGAEYEYSNFAQGLLGHVLARRMGMSYEDLVLDLIAGPLGMQDTRIALSRRMQENLATGHHEGSHMPGWHFDAMAGAGAIRSTASDMLYYLAANLGHLESPLFPAMKLSHEQRHNKAGTISVGLGWHIIDGAYGAIYSHGGGTGGYRTFAGFVKETGRGVIVMTNTTADADDIALFLLGGIPEMRTIRPHIASVIRRVIETKGAEAAWGTYFDHKESEGDRYDFSEMRLDQLGYAYLRNGDIDAAMSVFQINMNAHPNSSNVYLSMAEVMLADGQQEEAVRHYGKSLELNPGNTNAIAMLKNLGIDYEPRAPEVDEETLEAYTGTYELIPGFNIVISREGTQLYGQATGQDRFELHAASVTRFYLQVTDAQIEFNKNDAGDIDSLTLYQAGQVIPGRRVEE